MKDFRYSAVLLLLALTAFWPGSAATEPGPLVTPEWLSQNLDRDDLVVLDIRSAIGGASRWTYVSGHVPGAVYSDYVGHDWHDRDSEVPATLPAVEQIESLLGGLGISNDSMVVVVHSGVHSSDFSTAARVYWIFKLMGHDRVAILDGGFRNWEAAGLPVERGWNAPTAATFSASLRPELLADTQQVLAAVEHGAQLVDARARELYLGLEKAELAARYGTIPGAHNIPHQDMIDAESGRVISPRQLASLLRELELSAEHDTIVFCSIGHWSAATWFALRELAAFDNVRLYDGSMVEWTKAPERPVELGVEVGQGLSPP